jgi:hypothetical protein
MHARPVERESKELFKTFSQSAQTRHFASILAQAHFVRLGPSVTNHFLTFKTSTGNNTKHIESFVRSVASPGNSGSLHSWFFHRCYTKLAPSYASRLEKMEKGMQDETE